MCFIMLLLAGAKGDRPVVRQVVIDASFAYAMWAHSAADPKPDHSRNQFGPTQHTTRYWTQPTGYSRSSTSLHR
jgi:hypothetical protein